MISLQMNNYGNNSTVHVIRHLAPNLLRLCNIVTILICLPILNHLVVPCLQNVVSMKPTDDRDNPSIAVCGNIRVI